MRLGFVAVITALIGTATHALAEVPNLDGFWVDSDGEVILEFGPCGANRCGKVAWLKQPNGRDGQPLRDILNPDPALRNRPVCGLDVVKDFARQPDGTWNGTVYVSDYGKSFSGKAEIVTPTTIKVTGYVLLPIFGQSEVWTKVEPPRQRCGPANAKKP